MQNRWWTESNFTSYLWANPKKSMKSSLMTDDSLTEARNRTHLHVLTLSKQNLWMNEDIPWSFCCKVKSWAKRICFHFHCSLRENSVFEQGLYCVTQWLNNILFHSMNLFWECIMLIMSPFQFTMLIKGHRTHDFLMPSLGSSTNSEHGLNWRGFLNWTGFYYWRL